MTLPKTYSLSEVAEALGMSTRWVRQKCKEGAAHSRGGHKIRFTEEQYAALQASMVAPATKKKSA